MLQREEDLSVAAWLSASDADPRRLITFGPSTFPAYARLRYLPDPVQPSMNEADVQVPPDHATDIDVARIALNALAKYSHSSDTCYMCVWDGCGPFRQSELAHGPKVELPHRRYILLTGHLNDLANWSDLFDSECNSPPAFVWPEDRRWCFTSDVDPHWAGIGADTDVINQLVADRTTDVVRAQPSESQPTYY